MIRKFSVMAAVTACAVLLAGCTVDAPDSEDPRSAFLGGVVTPTPEAAINPAQDSWAQATVPGGYRVSVIAAGDEPAADTVSAAVREWAGREDAVVDYLAAEDDDQVEQRIEEAVALAPDIVIGAGKGVVDVFALLAPQHLDQQFLVVGAQLPEPTGNSTAVIWEGASFRGSGISTAEDDDPAAMTPERAADAVAAGIASIRWNLSGIVVRLP